MKSGTETQASRDSGGRFGGVMGVAAAVLLTAGLTSALHVRTAMGEKPAPRVPLTVEAVTPPKPQNPYVYAGNK